MLIAGLLILVPAALTIYVLIAIFRIMDGFFGPLVDRGLSVFIPDAHVPGLGLLMTLLVVLFLGWLSTSVVGGRVIESFERVIQRIPVGSTIYASTKGVMEAVSKSQGDTFTRVVLVEYPKKDIFVLGFVTRGARWGAVDPRTRDVLLVFVPTTPNPTSGFLLLVPRTEAVALPISVEEGIRMVISGGILLPEIPELHARQAPGWAPADRPPSASPADAGDEAPTESGTVAR